MPEDIVIREFRPEDASGIVRLHRESENCFEEMDVDETFIHHVASRSDYKFFVAEAKGELVGFCGVLYFTSFARSEVGPIAVAAVCRRRKIASKLLSRVLSFLRTKGIRRAIVKVKAANAGSAAFFSSHGFACEGFFAGYTKKREDVQQLVLFLD